MTEECIVVEGKLGVESEQTPVCSSDERIDLEERRVGFKKCLVEVRKKLHGGIDLFGAEAKAECHFSRLKGFQSHARVDLLPENLIWIFLRHPVNLRSPPC